MQASAYLRRKMLNNKKKQIRLRGPGGLIWRTRVSRSKGLGEALIKCQLCFYESKLNAAERETGSYSSTWQRNRSDPRIRHGNVTRLGDAHPSSRKSCLFCISHQVPGILLQGEWVLVLAKSAAVLAASTSAGWDLENPREITAVSRQIVPISAAGLQG